MKMLFSSKTASEPKFPNCKTRNLIYFPKIWARVPRPAASRQHSSAMFQCTHIIVITHLAKITKFTFTKIIHGTEGTQLHTEYTGHTVDTGNMVHTGNIIHTVDTVDTVDTGHTEYTVLYSGPNHNPKFY